MKLCRSKNHTQKPPNAGDDLTLAIAEAEAVSLDRRVEAVRHLLDVVVHARVPNDLPDVAVRILVHRVEVEPQGPRK